MDNSLVQDGQVGAKTVESLNAQLGVTPASGKVLIYGGSCYAREQPDKGSPDLGTCKEGTQWVYAGETSVDGWLKIWYGKDAAWVSPKYGRRI